MDRKECVEKIKVLNSLVEDYLDMIDMDEVEEAEDIKKKKESKGE